MVEGTYSKKAGFLSKLSLVFLSSFIVLVASGQKSPNSTYRILCLQQS
jgi:hypothetical protein